MSMVYLDIPFGIDLAEFLAGVVCEILSVGDQRETLSIPTGISAYFAGLKGRTKQLRMIFHFQAGRSITRGSPKCAKYLRQGSLQSELPENQVARRPPWFWRLSGM